MSKQVITRSPWMFDWPSWNTQRFPVAWSDMLDDVWAESGFHIEEFEEDGTYVIRAEAPGIDPNNDVDITLDRSALRIAVHRAQSEKKESAHHYRSEFRYGSFVRTLTLPSPAAVSDVKAEYENGILEIRVKLNNGKQEQRKISVTKK